MTHTGLFISFEGIDGAGKSTHIDGLAAAFKAQGRHVTLTREPGGTPLAEKLRALVLHDAMDPLCEALLIFAARRDHLQNVIEPALARGDVVLCDRFTDATFAYQGSGRGFDGAVLLQLEAWVQALPEGTESQSATGLRQPDVTVWFELDPAIAAERLAGARVPDRFESQPVAFFQKVSDGYAQRAEADPLRFVRLNAAQTREAVWQQLAQHFVQRGWFPAHADTNQGYVGPSTPSGTSDTTGTSA
jgi:dTMP kinase